MGFLEKGLLLYLCITIGILFAAPQVIFSGTSQGATVLNFFNLNTSIDPSTGQVYAADPNSYGSLGFGSEASGNAAYMTNTTRREGSGFNPLTLVDVVFNILGWIGLFFKVLFSPILIFSYIVGLGLPAPIMFIFGLPLVFLMLIAIILFFRGVSN